MTKTDAIVTAWIIFILFGTLISLIPRHNRHCWCERCNWKKGDEE